MRVVLLALALAFFVAPAGAQKKKDEVCPWCKHDPELMKAAGIVSHDAGPFGTMEPGELPKKIPAAQWVFVETAHIRWATNLPSVNLDTKEALAAEAELARLALVLPGVPKKTKKLDPWLRAHLWAMKGEEFYARFQRLLQVEDEDFPESRGSGPYMGDGRYLGEKDKFEIVLHQSRSTHAMFTRDLAGVVVSGALRYHVPKRHKMLASIPCEDADLKKDPQLFAHIGHVMSHLMLCAYKHFSYDPPLWLDEGLALVLEKELDPTSTTNEGEEGTFNDAAGPRDWVAASRKMVAAGKGVGVTRMLAMNEVGELDEEMRLSCFAAVRWLVLEKPDELAKILGGVKGQLDAQGVPSGLALVDLQRKLFQEHLGLNFLQFDEAWKARTLAAEAPATK